MRQRPYLIRWPRAALVPSALVIAPLLVLGCDDRPRSDEDPHVVRDGREIEEDPSVLSPPILEKPIYACASVVTVSGFVPGATLEVFEGANQIASVTGTTSWGQAVGVSISFVTGQVITARQVLGGNNSPPSNAVTVTSHIEDYPSGLPRVRLDGPVLECGRAVGYRDVVPGAWVKLFEAPSTGGGGFGPAVEIGNVNSSSSANSYFITSSAFQLDARVHAESGICLDVAPPSLAEIVMAEPATIPEPWVNEVHQGVEIVTVWGSGGAPARLLNGATLDVFADDQPPGSERVGGQPTPGGGQQVGINPPAGPTANFWATQALCTTSPNSPLTPVTPCSELPAPKIKAPQPGDTQIELTEWVPGARILVYANGSEVGDGGGPVLNLIRPLQDGETIIVVQRIGDCISSWVYQIDVECTLGAGACSSDWPAFRHNPLRNAQQLHASGLTDPYQVMNLSVRWQYPPSGQPALGQAFRASPIVWEGRVYVGNGDGRLYALDAATGAELWRYPPAGDPPLTTQFLSNPSSRGIASSAMIGIFREDGREVVILGAPDQSIGAGLGSGRLFALDPVTGAEVWKSPEIAVLNGLTSSATTELHEQIGYSSPLVFNDRVYIGIANHGDNPIQNGRVAAVDLTSGSLVGAFGFVATSTRGGGVWSSVAGGFDDGGIYITTGNSRCWNGGCQSAPATDHGLSLLRLDPSSGSVVWKHQPVPFEMDDDPDWASGPTLIPGTCGDIVVSTMKDGWSYGVDAGSGTPGPASVRWQFPPTGTFSPGDGTVHGDSRYLVPGAAWRDVFLTMTGGENVTTNVSGGFHRVHALNACAGRGSRVRWIADVPNATPGGSYRLGPPTVTRGIVFIGTHQSHVVAIADPSVWPLASSRCSNPDVTVANCVANGFSLIPEVKVLANVDLGAGSILTEPALAGGSVFVATSGGRVFMLAP